MMQTYQAISLLMAYPEAATHAALPELAEAIRAEGLLPPAQEAELIGFISELAKTDLMDLQADYVALFDRGRAVSLHLFEHVHGESRDRGQAMVDLIELYAAQGLALDAHELPDYLPLFLEFLAQLPADQARAQLAECTHIVALLGARLAERGSAYHVLFDALEALAGGAADLDAIRDQVANEGPDQTIERMDEIWEEEQVTFLGNQDACSSPYIQPAGGACPSAAGPHLAGGAQAPSAR